MSAKRPSKAPDKKRSLSEPALQPMNLILGPAQIEIVTAGSVPTAILGLPIMREDFVTTTGLLNK